MNLKLVTTENDKQATMTMTGATAQGETGRKIRLLWSATRLMSHQTKISYVLFTRRQFYYYLFYISDGTTIIDMTNAINFLSTVAKEHRPLNKDV